MRFASEGANVAINYLTNKNTAEDVAEQAEKLRTKTYILRSASSYYSVEKCESDPNLTE